MSETFEPTYETPGSGDKAPEAKDEKTPPDIIFGPRKGRVGDTNVLVTIHRAAGDLKDPVVSFMTKAGAEKCEDLGNVHELIENKYIKKKSENISGSHQIEVYIDILDFETPESFNRIKVKNAYGKDLWSQDCFQVLPKKKEGPEE
jgi:hypothetical protein